MLPLRTVEPYRLGIFDVDCIGQDVGGSTERSISRHEAREESVRLVGLDVLDGYAGLVEGGLNDGMILQEWLVCECYEPE
jgi:hypothetical protein